MQPAVEERAGPFVRVEEENDPGGRGRRVGEFVQKHRGEYPLRVHDQSDVLLAPEARAEACPQPVCSLGELSRVQGARESSHARHHSQSGQSCPRRGHAARRRSLGLRFESGDGGGLRLAPAFAVGGEESFQFLEAAALGAQLAADLRHRLRHAADALVDIGRERAFLAGHLFQFSHQERLSDTGVAVHMEEEPVPLVLGRQVEVAPERGPLVTTPHEPGPPALPDQLLHRRPRRHPTHPRHANTRSLAEVRGPGQPSSD
ncbi:hypothetical protein [Streptomyces canus]|uniref:hypothetical protein n=1 Tax=Streptomyces canus TaxID=58343 RepID=UPI00386A194A